MNELKTIVCATDLSEGANKALPFAAQIASQNNAKLIVAHVIDLPAVTPFGETMVDPHALRSRVEKSAKEQVSEIMSHCSGNINWELNIAIGYPAKEILQIANENNANLLVAATHSRTGIERLLLGSVSQKLMHTLEVPFIIVPGNIALERISQTINSILVACDFSPDSASAIRWGIKFAKTFEAELILATVIDNRQLSEFLKLDPQNEYALSEKFQTDLDAQLKNMLPKDEVSSIKSKTVVLAGQAHDELNKYAILNKVDMIIMGVHGRGFIENLLVGSTTDRLVRLGQFPVMAVR